MRSKAEDYRAGAAILLRVAGTIDDNPETKQVFEDLAREWLRLAEQMRLRRRVGRRRTGMAHRKRFIGWRADPVLDGLGE